VAAALDDYVFSVKCPTDTTADQCNVPDLMRLKTSAPAPLRRRSGRDLPVRLHFCGPWRGASTPAASPPCPPATRCSAWTARPWA
jgi:hypothetical protein